MTRQSASFTQNQPETASQWFVATVRPQHEATVVRALEFRGIEPFCPTYTIRRDGKRSDRQVLQPPLFPGYVFCRFRRPDRANVIKTPGITSIVGFGGASMAVDDGEIARVRAMVSSGLPVQPWPYLEAGQRIVVERGPLKGVEGLVVEVKKDFRLVVSVTLLQRSVAVTIDRELVCQEPEARYSVAVGMH